MSLHYRSNRVPGHRTSNEVTAPLTARNVAGSLRAATVKVEVAGVELQTTASCDQGDCAPEVEASLVWDGRDRFGRTLTGRQLAKVTQRLEYPVVYGLADDSYEQAFARASTLPSTVESPYGVLAREKVSHVWLGGRDARSFGLGGWTLDAVHVYDPASRVVTYGDGTRRTADVGRNEYIIDRVTLPATFEYPEPGPARTALACDGGNVLRVPVEGPPVVLAAIPDGQTNCRAVIPASDGTLYVFTNGRRLYRRELGQWVHVAGNGSSSGSMVSGTLATQGPLADFTSIFNQ